MKLGRFFVLALALAAVLGPGAPAGLAICDWNEGDPAKWIQRPDTTVDGIDIRMDKEDGKPRILADDFLCTETGLITDVHLWVSWLHDVKGTINSIHLSVHSDIPDPDGEGPLYSMPGPELWAHDFEPAEFTEKLYSTLPGMGEWWWDPANGVLIPSGDNQIWQVNICIDPSIAFMQQGTLQEPVVYWLDVSVATSGGQIGWKTRARQDGHFNDDAVWRLEGTPIWNELRYPQEHPYHPESLDFAFVLTGEMLQDFGDAPELPYPTLLASNGARHGPSNMYMGNLIDYEPDGQPNPIAVGDDASNLPDEDGVQFLTQLAIGQPAQVAVTVTSPGPAFLTAWVDFNGDGTWATPGDQVFAAIPVMPGLNALSFMVPPTATPGPTFARFRLHGVQTPIAFTGYQPDGEVEDYQVPIVPTVQITAWRTLKTHSGAGELAIVLNAAATATGSTAGGIRVESRNSAAQNGLRKIEVDFSRPVTINNPAQVTVSGALTTGCSVSGTGCVMGPVGPYPPASVTMTAPQTMTIAFANGAAPGDGCYILNIGPAVLNAVLVGDTDCKVRMLQSDSTGDGLVALADLSQIKSRFGQPVTATNCASDQNLAAGIGLADISQAKSRFGRRALCP